MAVFRECANYDMCLQNKRKFPQPDNKPGSNTLECEGCHTYCIYKKGFEDGVKALASKINQLANKGVNGENAVR